MKKLANRVIVWAGVLVAGLFFMFVVNQTIQFVAAAERISPVFGTVVMWSLIGLYAIGIAAFLYNVLRLPRPLRPPATDEHPEFERFLSRLRARIRGNRSLQGRPLDTRQDIEAALEELGEQSDELIRDSALQTFFVTALSQNGNLDALAVVVLQGRLVYDIARLHYQRPTVRDLIFLYTNVLTAAIVARQLDDLDMTEYLAPITNALTGSVVGSIPGTQAAANAAIHAVLTGSANAYMTLRVGIIAKRLCGSVTLPERGAMRQAAFVEAAKMFPGIVGQGTKQVVDLLKAALVKGGKDAVTAFGRGLGRAYKSVKASMQEVAAGREKRRTAGPEGQTGLAGEE